MDGRSVNWCYNIFHVNAVNLVFPIGLTLAFPRLYGVVAMQAYLYMHNNHKDTGWLRLGVWIVLLVASPL